MNSSDPNTPDPSPKPENGVASSDSTMPEAAAPSPADPVAPPPSVPPSVPGTGPTVGAASSEPIPPAQPPAQGARPDTASTARQWAVGLHLSALLGLLIPLPFANLIGPLVIWLVKRESSPLIDMHGREAVNFNLAVALAMVVLIVLSVITFGIALLLTIPLGLVLVLLWLIFPIIAAFKTSEGEDYRYPVTVRFI